MTKDQAPTNPVDPNYTPQTNDTPKPETDLGATKPLDHPCTMSAVDGNYSAESAPGFPKEKGGSSSFPGGGGEGGGSSKGFSGGGDLAGVEGAGGKFTDSAGNRPGDDKDGGD